ncbi:hypothetical protein [Coprobacter fastidiosus]|jgi:hypothetical protein|uniref:hypothetical protein n=1 Tax=Coprobacter fastidiosus TaxID=1099853 RepID=UPI0022E62EB4|nr:hypothetical protein [Coprobacter fastidiosus]
MKKALFICGFLMLVMSSFSQKEVEFFLQSNGSFLTADSSDYVIVPFEGKTASELYSMVKSNAMSLYRDPKEVMSEDDSQVYDKESKSYKSFYFHVRSLFTREGTVKPRKLKHKLRIEDSINYSINYLLGFYQKNTDKDNNW